MTPPPNFFAYVHNIYSSLWPRSEHFSIYFGEGFKCSQMFFGYILLHLVQKPNTRFSKKSRHLQLCWIIYFFTERASFIISLIGISNTLGRLITGAFVDLPWVSSLVVTNCSLVSLIWLKLFIVQTFHSIIDQIKSS